jgi:hypothetical protein
MKLHNLFSLLPLLGMPVSVYHPSSAWATSQTFDFGEIAAARRRNRRNLKRR